MPQKGKSSSSAARRASSTALRLTTAARTAGALTDEVRVVLDQDVVDPLPKLGVLGADHHRLASVHGRKAVLAHGAMMLQADCAAGKLLHQPNLASEPGAHLLVCESAEFEHQRRFCGAHCRAQLWPNYADGLRAIW